MALLIESPSFSEGGTIPVRHTYEGANISPNLHWTNGPEGTKSYALIVDDPDAPVGIWVHWVVYNISEKATSLTEALPAMDTLPNGERQGMNDFGKVGYGGPCPPKGNAHRYYFKLYALDTVLALPARTTKEELEKAMKGHILAEAKLMGKYKRS